MSLLTRKRTILAKIESSYGVDPSPTGALNAILVKNITPTPQETNLVPRDLIRPYFGNFTQLPAAIYGKMAIEVELAGSGTAGTAPAYGPLLRACGMSETALAAAHTGTAPAGSTATTLKLAAGASAVDDAYLGMRVNLTGGTGGGQSAVIYDYNGSTKTATICGSWTVTPDATTTYTIPAQVAYAPITNNPEAITTYFNQDGVLHKFLGARGSVDIKFPLWGIPTLAFQFTGIYVDVADVAAPTVVLSSFQQPLTINNVNTSGLKIQGYSAAQMSDLSISLNTTPVYRSLVGGSQQVLLTDRKGQGGLTIEATTVAQKDWWTAVKNAVVGDLNLTHGLTAGNIVQLAAPAMQLTQPSFEDMDGVSMIKFGAQFVPVNGNDELFLSVQ